MPKERRASSLSSNPPRVSPYPLRSSRNTKQKEQESPLESEGSKQWEETRCPICMEPPHNAVLLKCSSFSKGCRPYMCDTTSRHSNCFKQYRKNSNNRFDSKSLSCPLCRGEVYGTMTVKGARRFMNAKLRSCPSENCDFTGTYSRLNNHVKTEHPDSNPTKVDPTRLNDWENMERETDYADMLSTMRFSFVNEDEQEENEERSEYINPILRVHNRVPYAYSSLESSLGVFMDNLFGESLVGNMRSRLRVSNLSGHWEYHATVYGGWLP